jgi:acyl-CoA thioesterase
MSADEVLNLLRVIAVGDQRAAGFRAPRSLCLGPSKAKHMSGGACVAAAAFALESAIERPLIQLSAQFVSPLANQAVASVQVEATKPGRSITQASAAIWSEGLEVIRLFATLGARDGTHDQQWAEAGSIPEPAQCPTMSFIRAEEGDLHTHLELRQVPHLDQMATGSLAFWVHSPSQSTESITAPFLALIADYIPEAVHGSRNAQYRTIARPAASSGYAAPSIQRSFASR